MCRTWLKYTVNVRVRHLPVSAPDDASIRVPEWGFRLIPQGAARLHAYYYIPGPKGVYNSAVYILLYVSTSYSTSRYLVLARARVSFILCVAHRMNDRTHYISFLFGLRDASASWPRGQRQAFYLRPVRVHAHLPSIHPLLDPHRLQLTTPSTTTQLRKSSTPSSLSPGPFRVPGHPENPDINDRALPRLISV